MGHYRSGTFSILVDLPVHKVEGASNTKDANITDLRFYRGDKAP